MPTTASLAASVTSPFAACTRREIGMTRCANRHATKPMSGVATAEYSVRRRSTSASTITPPAIIIALWNPCTTPHPMKYRIGKRSFVARDTTCPVECRS